MQTTVYSDVMFQHKEDFSGYVRISTKNGVAFVRCNLLKVFMVALAIAPDNGPELSIEINGHSMRLLNDKEAVIKNQVKVTGVIVPLDALQFFVEEAMRAQYANA